MSKRGGDDTLSAAGDNKKVCDLNS